VLVFLDFSQALVQFFHQFLSKASPMVVHGLLLCKLKNLQNYSDDGAGMLVNSFLNGRTQFVRCG
jgi:hypothetical protein